MGLIISVHLQSFKVRAYNYYNGLLRRAAPGSGAR